MAGRTSWWPCDHALLRRELVIELGEEFGGDAVSVYVQLRCWAQEQRASGEVRGGFRALSREAFVTVGHALSIVERASEIGLLDELQIDPDGRRFSCRISGWRADQERGRAALRQDAKRNQPDTEMEPVTPGHGESRSVTPKPLHNKTEEEQEIAATPQRARAATSRSQAETVKCPRCGADPGAKCMGARKERESAHLERHHAVGELLHLPQQKTKPQGPQPYQPQTWAVAMQAEHFDDLPVAAIENAAFTLKMRHSEPTVEAIRALLFEGKAA